MSAARGAIRAVDDVSSACPGGERCRTPTERRGKHFACYDATGGPTGGTSVWHLGLSVLDDEDDDHDERDEQDTCAARTG